MFRPPNEPPANLQYPVTYSMIRRWVAGTWNELLSAGMVLLFNGNDTGCWIPRAFAMSAAVTGLAFGWLTIRTGSGVLVTVTFFTSSAFAWAVARAKSVTPASVETTRSIVISIG